MLSESLSYQLPLLLLYVLSCPDWRKHELIDLTTYQARRSPQPPVLPVKAETPEPEPEEDEDEKADRKRRQLEKELEAKKKAPAKKKRKF